MHKVNVKLSIKLYLKIFAVMWCFLSALITQSISTAYAGEITQFFPAVPAGETEHPAESGWRIKWEVLEAGTHSYGGSAVLEFQSIEFMRGKKEDGTDDWIKILNNLAMAEMYVPYNDGSTAFFDISGFRFDMLEARSDYLPQNGVVSAKILDQYVIGEVSDDGIRWLDNVDNFKIRRGQVLKLWTNLHAANYTYTLVYTFSDDGRISVRVGGTAQNFKNWDGSLNGLNSASHVHMGAWRMEFDLGDPLANSVEVVERVVDATTALPRIQFRPFNGNREGGELWDATKYTTIKVTNSSTKNRHNQQRNISYVLKTAQLGKLQSDQPVTRFDYWVSRVVPDNEDRQNRAPELKFVDLPGNISVPEQLEDEAVALWHNSGLFHIPRGEDFGEMDYFANEGAAINSYAGFDLVPVNLWHKTPFLKR